MKKQKTQEYLLQNIKKLSYFACSEANRYLYASCQVESTLDYHISVTLRPIEFLIGLIDSRGFDYITNMSLILLYISSVEILQCKIRINKFKKHCHSHHEQKAFLNFYYKIQIAVIDIISH